MPQRTLLEPPAAFQVSTQSICCAAKNRYIMAQIRVNTLNSEGIALIARIADMFAGINHISIAEPSAGAILFCLGRIIDYTLHALWRFIKGGIKTHDLMRFAAYHRDGIHVFPCLCPRFPTNTARKVLNIPGSFPQSLRFFIQLYTFALFMPKTLPTPRPLTPE